MLADLAFDAGARGAFCTSPTSMLESESVAAFLRFGGLSSASDSSGDTKWMARFEGAGRGFLGRRGRPGGLTGEGVGDDDSSRDVSSLEGRFSSAAAWDARGFVYSSRVSLFAKSSRRLSGLPNARVVITGRVEFCSSAVVLAHSKICVCEIEYLGDEQRPFFEH